MTECPDCLAREKAKAAPAAAVAPPPAAALPVPPPQASYPPPQAPYLPPPAHPPAYALPQPRQGMPTWLLTILFAAVFGAVVGGVYYYIENRSGRSAAGGLKLENVTVAEEASGKADPMLKYLEVSGLRLIQSAGQKVEMRFVVVNHSAAAVSDLNAKVRLMAKANDSAPVIVGECLLKGGALGPYESKEFSAALNTNKKAYELPDWQFLIARLEPVK